MNRQRPARSSSRPSGDSHPWPPLRALIFDMDGTLYQSRELDERYERSVYRALAERYGLTPVQARQRFATLYHELQERLGRPPSKLYTLGLLGISFARWAEGAGRVRPTQVLRPDRRLRRTLLSLAASFKMGVVTNNSRENTDETLAALGIADCFDEVLTLSESRTYKPSPILYSTMAERLRVDPQDCLSIGDRIHQDLTPAAAIGMHTCLVHRVSELHRLAKIWRPRTARRRRTRSADPGKLARAEAVEALRHGRLAVLPTDTVYGLAALPEASAVRWLYRAKSRPEERPLVLLLSDAAHAERLARVSATAARLMREHWPGALTLILPARTGAPEVRAARGGRTVGLRVPDHPLTREIIRDCGGVLAVTSANSSGEPEAVSADQVPERVRVFSELVLDEGELAGTPSTVARVDGSKVRVLRQGKIRV